MQDQPPKLPERIFSLFCGNAFLDDLFGDLEELYHNRRIEHGRLNSKLYYWLQAIRLLFSYTITKRKRSSAYSNHYQGQKLNFMLFNYIKISIRNIAKNKTFTFLNVLGLGLGMCIALLALATFVDLKQFDRFHDNASDIYRLTTIIEENGVKNHYASTPPVLSHLAEEQLTGIEEAVHINDYFFPSIQTAGEPIQLVGYITEPRFFDLFDFPLIAGVKEVLDQPNTVVISQEAAKTLFDKVDVVGKQIETENYGTLQIGAVLAEFPKKTHFAFDLLIGYQKNQVRATSNSYNWTEFGSNYYYFKTKLSASKIEEQINNLSQTGLSFYQEENLKASFELQPLLSINPGKNLSDGLGVIYDRPGMYMFIGMALLILVPACLNYSNMAIANVLKRSKEIGIRKIMGSANRQIIYQFMVETVLICLMGLVVSVLLFNLIREELLSMLVGGSAMSFSLDPLLLTAFVLFAILTGIVTGLMPALYFAKITPLNAIRRTFNAGRVSISGMRKVLLVFQFVLSLGFMIGIGVLVKQYRVSLNFDQGFAKENVLVLPINPDNQQLIENALSTQSAVTDMSFTSSIPGTSLGSTMYFYSNDGLDSLRAWQIYMDNQFLEHMDISLAWGADELRDSGIEEVIVNQTLMDRLANLREDKADSLMALLAGNSKVQIVGVVEDYNHEPLNERITPMVLRRRKEALSYALLTINSNDVMSTLASIEDSWKSILPEEPFRATFLEHEIEKAYTFFIIGLKIFGLMAALAISVSCLGLLGMVIYTTENRRKEVAIRKTLGANKWKLLYTLSGLFFRMWIIALIIGVPLSFLFYDNVLMSIYNKFSSGVGFSEVAISSLFTLGLGLLSIMIQSNRVMNTNPAQNLRNE